MATSKPEADVKEGIPGRVTFLEGRGDLPMLEVTSAWSTAEIYLHGAHVSHFKKKDEPPLLFLSQCSRFAKDEPIRGGIPIVFPWFGPRESFPQHGFARLKLWELKELAPAADGSVKLRFRLPDYPEASSFPPFSVEYCVTVNEALTLELSVTNNSADQEFAFENCLHTYFEVGDIAQVSVAGLKGRKYLDKVENFVQKTDNDEAIQIASEIDRIYLNTTDTVAILDKSLRRKIVIEKHGSVSTVVWNPWITKAQQMPDFGNEEFEKMVCVESGNVASNNIKLPPNESSTLQVKLSTESL